MKKIRLFLLLSLLLTTVQSLASAVGDKFTLNKVTYQILTLPTGSANGTVSAVGTTLTGAITPINFPGELTDTTGARFTVTYLGETCFQSKTGITTVELPATITGIASYAFKQSSVTAITLPKNLNQLGGSAFNDALSLTSITAPTDNATYTSENGVLFNKTKTKLLFYPPAKADASYSLPTTVTTLERGAFTRCNNLTTVSLGSVQTINKTAFNYCKSLTTINIPASATIIESEFTAYCYGITDINVDGGNPNYASINGVLTNKNKTELIQYPSGNTRTTYTVPSTIQTIKKSAFAYTNKLTTLTIPSTVKTIEEWAFNECAQLKTVTIEEGVKEIKARAFNYCSKLTTCKVPASANILGENIFTHCSSMKNSEVAAGNAKYKSVDGVIYTADMKTLYSFPKGRTTTDTGANASTYTSGFTIPASVTSIADYGFFNSKLANDLIIPNTVESIGRRAFEGAAENLTFASPATLKTIKESAFRGMTRQTAMTVPASVTTIGNEAFREMPNLTTFAIEENSQLTTMGILAVHNCPKLTTVSIGDNCALATLGENAFSNCTALQTVTVGSNSLSKLGDYAFSGCTALTNVTFEDPAKLTTIGTRAFENATALQAITLPNSLKTIESSAFNGCAGLTTVNFQTPAIIESIGSNAFQNSGVTNITLPESVKRIEKEAFNSCHNLETVSIPKNVDFVSAQAFIFCSKLQNINVDEDNAKYASMDGLLTNKDYTKLLTFPAGKANSTYTRIPTLVTAIDSAFYSCYNLDNVTLPRTVTTIGDYSFSNCKKLKSISFVGDNIPTLQANAFLNTNAKAVTIYVRKRWHANTANATQLAQMKTMFKDVHPSFYATTGYDREVEYFPTSTTAVGVISFEDYTLNATTLSTERTSVIVPATVKETYNGTNYTYSVNTVLDFAFEEKTGNTGKVWSITFLAPIDFVGLNAFTRPSITELIFTSDKTPAIAPDEFKFVNGKLLNTATNVYVKPSKVSDVSTAWADFLNGNTIQSDIPVTTSNRYAAVARPFRTTYNQTTGVKPYRPYEYYEYDTNKAMVRAVSVDGYEIPAETAIVLFSEAAAAVPTTYQISEDQSALTLPAVPSVQSGNTDVENVFFPTLEDTYTASLTTAGVYYALSKQGYFAKINMASTNPLRPWIAYLRLPVGSLAKQITLGFVDSQTGTTTGIEEVEAGNATEEAAYYNLQGIKTQRPQQKGVYVKDGKKVIVR